MRVGHVKKPLYRFSVLDEVVGLTARTNIDGTNEKRLMWQDNLYSDLFETFTIYKMHGFAV